MPKDRQIVERLIEVLEYEGYETRSYSGRGTFGKECVAVVDVSMWEIAKTLLTEQYDGEFEDLPEPKQDSMELLNVLYWPSYEWPKD